ncbi:MAG TPA: PhzF family phenazine biosynthesis protein [Acidobacteriaceae bacterium]|jgi:trans-2,3-dihydro-3-hydroxyanthranilate isomerase|nr:PhzF family phenazine biosynthesis protein [Acidobacteriaceae bacterium]
MPASHQHRYRVVDVFTQNALEGNPLAVFPDAAGIDERLMPKIARELNLSETVFVLPATRPECAAKIRIFTPGRELPFAGHPTVGAAFVLLDENLVPRQTPQFVLEEGIGPVAVRVDPGEQPLIWLRTPPITRGKTFDRAACAAALSVHLDDLLPIDPQLVSAGNPAVFVALQNPEAVDRTSIDLRGLQSILGPDAPPTCIFVFAPTPAGAYSRMFAPELGIIEDPATGSATGPLASFMLRHGLVPAAHSDRFISEQGTKMGRRSLLHVRIARIADAVHIDVGGYVTPLVEATMSLPAAP